MKMKTENGQTKQPLSIIFNFQVIEKSLYFFNNWYGIMSLQIKFIRICAVFFWLFFWGFFLLWISLTVWFWLLLLLEMVSFYSFLFPLFSLFVWWMFCWCSKLKNCSSAGTISMFFLDKRLQVWVHVMNFSARPLQWISWLNTSLILMLAYMKVAYFSFYFLPLHLVLIVKLIS